MTSLGSSVRNSRMLEGATEGRGEALAPRLFSKNRVLKRGGWCERVHESASVFALACGGCGARLFV